MKKFNLTNAHIKSLKILIIQVLTLPLKIYHDTICKFSNNTEEKQTEFKVLNWMIKSLESLIVLSYTLGTIVFLLILTTVIDDGYPIWYNNSKGDSANYYRDYDEYIRYEGDDAYYNRKEFYEDLERREKARYSKRFDEEMFFILLTMLYFLPVGLSFSKELLIKFGDVGSNNNT